MAAGPAVEHHTRHGPTVSRGRRRPRTTGALDRRYSDRVRQATGNPTAPAPVLRDPGAGPDGPGTGAFFDVDNTIIRGASSFHLAVGLYRRGFFRKRDLVEFAGYLEDLITQVGTVYRKYRYEPPAVQLKKALEEVNLDRYKEWGRFQVYRDRNIEGVLWSFTMGF